MSNGDFEAQLARDSNDEARNAVPKANDFPFTTIQSNQEFLQKSLDGFR